MDWFEEEMKALAGRYKRDEISADEYRNETLRLRRDRDEAEYRRDMIDAGRGAQLGEW